MYAHVKSFLANVEVNLRRDQVYNEIPAISRQVEPMVGQPFWEYDLIDVALEKLPNSNHR